MRIAFVGKGGSGKTTLTGLFSMYLAKMGGRVLAIDADINQHLGQSVGLQAEYDDSKSLDRHEEAIKEYLAGSNTLIGPLAHFMKTTPPGTGSRLIGLSDPILDKVTMEANGVKIVATGALREEDVGTKCFHGKTGLVEILLNHLIDGKDEYLVADMTAGADWFASGLFTKFDAVFLVVEPSQKSVDIYHQFLAQLGGRQLSLYLVANKVEDDADVEYIRQKTGVEPAAVLTNSKHVRVAERSGVLALDGIEDVNLAALANIKNIVDSTEKEWSKFYETVLEFHILNANTWMSSKVGRDLTSQIDPEFKYPA